MADRGLYSHLPRPGKLVIIFGPMFASKTSTLIAHLHNYEAVKYRILLINHKSDKRDIGKSGILTTHRKCPSRLQTATEVSVRRLEKVDPDLVANSDVIGIDEAQFYPSMDLIKKWLLEMHKTIFVAGLLATSEGTIFGEFYKLIPLACKIEHLKAICEFCLKEKNVEVEATMTLCMVEKQGDELVGSKEFFAPACLYCWEKRRHLIDASDVGESSETGDTSEEEGHRERDVKVDSQKM